MSVPDNFLSSAFVKSVLGYISNGAKYIAEANAIMQDILGAAGAAIVGGTASVLGGGKFANGAQTAAIQYLFNEASTKREITESEEGIYLSAENSKSGFQISQEGAVQVFKKFGFSNIPDALKVDQAGILLADDILAVGVPAQDLVAALEPSPFGKLRMLITGTKIVTNGLKNEARNYWRDSIDDISVGAGVRNTVRARLDFKERYYNLPR